MSGLDVADGLRADGLVVVSDVLFTDLVDRRVSVIVANGPPAVSWPFAIPKIRIAGHFLADPTRKDQLLALVLKLDFGNNDAFENAAVNVDMPSFPGVLDEETLFLQSIVSTYGREHPLGVGDRDIILKLRLRNADPRSLDGDRRDVISGYPNPDLAVLVCSDQTVA